MPAATLPHNNQTQRSTGRPSELQRLRRQYNQARQALLLDLSRRQQELQEQLQKVQAELQLLSEEKAPSPETPATPTTETVASPRSFAKRGGRITLNDALVEVARDADHPLTARELAAELVRRKYPTKSSHLTGMVQNRLSV